MTLVVTLAGCFVCNSEASQLSLTSPSTDTPLRSKAGKTHMAHESGLQGHYRSPAVAPAVEVAARIWSCIWKQGDGVLARCQCKPGTAEGATKAVLCHCASKSSSGSSNDPLSQEVQKALCLIKWRQAVLKFAHVSQAPHTFHTHLAAAERETNPLKLCKPPCLECSKLPPTLS